MSRPASQLLIAVSRQTHPLPQLPTIVRSFHSVRAPPPFATFRWPKPNTTSFPRYTSSTSPILSALRSQTRLQHQSFSTSALTRAPRPYYGGSARGGSSAGWRRKIDNLPHSYILYGIIGSSSAFISVTTPHIIYPSLNVATYFVWQYGDAVLRQYRDPTIVKFLSNNFTTSWNNIRSGRIWCLVTSAFSHEQTGHILLNLVSLYFMAPPVMSMLGGAGFLGLYLLSGIAASAVSVIVSQLQGQSAYYSAHGASGAIYGTIAFFAASYPRTTFLLFFVVPVPAWLCVGGIAAYDVYSSLSRRKGTTDSAGHVGGLLAGLLFFLRRRF